MRDSPAIFSLPRDTCVTALLHGLESLATPRVRGPLRASRAWLDTFDWRLLRAGLVLEHRRAGAAASLRLEARDAAAPVQEVRAGEVAPRFAADLPSPALRRRLAPVAGVRALLVRNTMRGTLHEIALTDARDKTVARLELWRPARRGPCLARAGVLRGFERSGEALREHLAARADARALERDPLLAGARGLATAPGEYPGWKLAGLDARMRTDDAMQRVLAHYRAIMDLNLPGVVQDLDSEFLHDFRVGLRRSRALLRRVPGVFPPARLEPFLDDFRWLSRLTGEPRDADVHCLVFPAYAAALGDGAGAALGPLFEELARLRERAHEELSAALSGPRFRRRWAAWERFLARPAARASRQPQGPLPIARSASRAIAKATRKVCKQGRSLDDSSPAEAYHELRKSCKNLRYLIDAFEGSLQEPALGKATKRLRRLQDVLGEHQDLDVHRATLEHLHRALAARGALAPETHAAFDDLVAELARRAAATRGRFARELDRFHRARPDRALAAGAR